MSSLKDQIVIVTGGTKGIGFATVKKFLSDGCHVVVLGRHEGPTQMDQLASCGDAKNRCAR